jgi:hypothetical protein
MIVVKVHTHTHARASRSCHAKGTVVSPLGAQNTALPGRSSQLAIPHRIASHIIRSSSSGGQPASAQHISSHALIARVVSSISNEREPSLSSLYRLLACLLSRETRPSKSAPSDKSARLVLPLLLLLYPECRADPPHSPQDRKGIGCGLDNT